MKKIWSHIIECRKYTKVVFLVYTFQLLLACTVGIQVYQVMEASIGSSLSTHQLLANFDYTIFQDFINKHGSSLSSLVGMTRWLLFVYFIFGIFINAGLLHCVVKNDGSKRTFFEGGYTYFFTFAKLALLFIPILLVWTLGILGYVIINGTSIVESLPNEKYYFALLIVLILIYALGIGFIILWSLLSRLSIMRSESSVIKSLRSSFIFIRQNAKMMVAKYVQLVFVFILITIAYYGICSSIGMISIVTIIISFIVQQLYILFRIFWRVWLYRSINYSK